MGTKQAAETKRKILYIPTDKNLLYCFSFFLALQVLLFKTTNLSESRIKAGYWNSICSLFQSLSTPLSILLHPPATKTRANFERIPTIQCQFVLHTTEKKKKEKFQPFSLFLYLL